MSEQKHTPGPWEVLNQTEVFTSLGADSGDGIKASPSDGWMIADCGGCVTFTEIGAVELGYALRKANAHLIAAAPDLLEAAEELSTVWGKFIDSFPYQPGIGDDVENMEFREIAKLRKAIAKARGES